MVVRFSLNGGSAYEHKPLNDIAKEVDSIVARNLTIESCESPEEFSLLLQLEEIIEKTGPIFFIINEHDICSSFFFLNKKDEVEFDEIIRSKLTYYMLHYYQLRNAFSDLTYKIAKEINKERFIAKGTLLNKDYSFKVYSENMDLDTHRLYLRRPNKRAFAVPDSAKLTNLILDSIKIYENN